MTGSIKELADTLRSIERDIDNVENKLNYTTDNLLTDSLIFEMAALYKRHAYYLGLCRELKVTAGDGYAV